MSGEWQQTFVDFPEGTRIQDRLSHRHRGIVESVVLVPLYTVRFYGHKDSEIVDWWTLRAALPSSAHTKAECGRDLTNAPTANYH